MREYQLVLSIRTCTVELNHVQSHDFASKVNRQLTTWHRLTAAFCRRPRSGRTLPAKPTVELATPRSNAQSLCVLLERNRVGPVRVTELLTGKATPADVRCSQVYDPASFTSVRRPEDLGADGTSRKLLEFFAHDVAVFDETRTLTVTMSGEPFGLVTRTYG
jgi:hypothetical protein